MRRHICLYNIHWYVTTGWRKYKDRSYLHEEKVPLYKGQDLAVGLTSCWSQLAVGLAVIAFNHSQQEVKTIAQNV